MIDATQAELHDTSPMPFGKHKGIPMQDVPVNYLHWLWSNGLKADKQSPVGNYIRRCLGSLRVENTDLIW